MYPPDLREGLRLSQDRVFNRVRHTVQVAVHRSIELELRSNLRRTQDRVKRLQLLDLAVELRASIPAEPHHVTVGPLRRARVRCHPQAGRPGSQLAIDIQACLQRTVGQHDLAPLSGSPLDGGADVRGSASLLVAPETELRPRVGHAQMPFAPHFDEPARRWTRAAG